MTVFVTGATGVLGRPLLRRLIRAGQEVRALCRSDANRKTLQQLGAVPIKADLFDAVSLARAMADCDAVFHLATRIPPVRDMKKPGVWDENDRIRGDGTTAIVAAALRNDDVKTILYPSVSFAYADGGDSWMDATSAKLDISATQKSTLAAEALVARFAASGGGRRGVVLRLGALYGPASAESRQALAMARKGFALPLTPPNSYRSLLWIEDAASALARGLESAPSGIFDVVEDDPFTQSEAVAALAAAVGRTRLWTLPRWLLKLALSTELRELLARSQRISNRRFREATGWHPEVASQRQGWARMAYVAARQQAPEDALA